MLINEAFQTFLEHLSGQSESNRRNYRMRLKRFLDANGTRPLVDLSAADVNRWHEGLQQRGYQEATLAGYRQALKAFMNYCLRRGWIDCSPAGHLKIGSFISKQHKLPAETAVTAAETIAYGWLRFGNTTQLRDALMFLLSVQSGPRLREIRELRLSEVTFALERGPDANGIYQVRSHGKTGEILVRFDEAVAAGLHRWLEKRPPTQIDRLFVGLRPTVTKSDPEPRIRPLSRSGATKAYERISEAAGLKRTILSHALRHRLGHNATKQYGAKIAAHLLNHKDADTAATAIAFYHHPDQDDISRAAAEMAASSQEAALANTFFQRAKRGD